MKNRTACLEGMAERLKLALAESGLPVMRVAKQAGISRSGLHDYLTGQRAPGVLTLAKICVTLRVSMDWIVFGKGNKDHGREKPTDKPGAAYERI